MVNDSPWRAFFLRLFLLSLRPIINIHLCVQVQCERGMCWCVCVCECESINCAALQPRMINNDKDNEMICRRTVKSKEIKRQKKKKLDALKSTQIYL